MIHHVWARPGHGPTEMAGLVLGWRRGDPGSWEAQVIYVDPRGRVSVEWLAADEVRPIENAECPAQPGG